MIGDKNMKVTDDFKNVYNKGLSWTVFRTNYELKKRIGIMENFTYCRAI